MDSRPGSSATGTRAARLRCDLQNPPWKASYSNRSPAGRIVFGSGECPCDKPRGVVRRYVQLVRDLDIRQLLHVVQHKAIAAQGRQPLQGRQYLLQVLAIDELAKQIGRRRRRFLRQRPRLSPGPPLPTPVERQMDRRTPRVRKAIVGSLKAVGLAQSHNQFLQQLVRDLLRIVKRASRRYNRSPPCLEVAKLWPLGRSRILPHRNSHCGRPL